MKSYHKYTAGKGWAKGILLALFVCLLFWVLIPFDGGMSEAKAETATPLSSGTGAATVHYYTVEATVNKDRTIDFCEEISFTMHITPESGVFYRSLPIEGDRFLNVQAEGVNNPKFSYRVIDNPDVDGFIDVECRGGVEKGATLTYRFTYTMECRFSNVGDNGMRIDFVGGGWPLALNNVDVKVHFPSATSSLAVYSSSFGSSRNDYADVVEQRGDYLHLHADTLPTDYSEFGYYAVPVTVEFAFADGVLLSGTFSDFSSPTLWAPFVAGLVALIGAILLVVFGGSRPILSTVVGFTAPNGMDPMELGYVLDGSIDNEDVTSMIYYFASKGYLHIALRDGNPVLIRKRFASLPDGESVHAQTLFEGLFDDGRTETEISDLQNQFYEHADKARLQIGVKRPKMYQPKSVGFFLLCGVASLAAFVLPLLLAGWAHIGGWYFPLAGLMMCIPVAVCSFVNFILENYRYKWKKGKRAALSLVAIIVSLIVSVIYMVTTTHVLTATERIISLIFGYAVLPLQQRLLHRREDYMETLGRILGFKEFILVTKKDRIEAMLETDPELFYDVLPYAQVMDVSEEWEEKFKSITIKPPMWYEGDYTLFDYWVIHRSMRSMHYAMASRPSNSGSSVGGGGGGGFSGGFSGGGGGGGGGGFR